MGIFTRTRDIITANINAMLDQAEDPEKIANLMVREMEDTLIEVKASCAGAKAASKRLEHEQECATREVDEWAARAQRAVEKGRDDLAREALVEKRRHTERSQALAQEREHCASVIQQYLDEINQLESKLDSAREKQRVLVQRHIHAVNKHRVQCDIRRFETSDVFARFDQVDQRIDRLHEEMSGPAAGDDLASEIEHLGDDEIEQELRQLKQSSVRV